MPIQRVLPAVVPIETSDPRVIGRAIERQVEIVSRFWAEDIYENLVDHPSRGGTPRKSGFARACWIVSVGQPSRALGGTPFNPSTAAADAGIASLQTWRLSHGAIFIVNNAPYIVRLNYGWSGQAQPGFVEQAFSRSYNTVAKTFKDL